MSKTVLTMFPGSSHIVVMRYSIVLTGAPLRVNGGTVHN